MSCANYKHQQLFSRPMNSSPYRKSTVASKHLITPRNTGHPWGIISARTCHPKPVGERRLWNLTANQHQKTQSQAFSWTVTKLTTWLSKLFSLVILHHKASQLPSERGPPLALSLDFRMQTGRPAPKKAAFHRNPRLLPPYFFLPF